jgi:hypothetical protein
MKRTLITSIFIALLSVIAVPVSSAFAANPASFTLSPSTSTVVKGNTFTISISENGDNVNIVTTALSYNSAQLQLVGTSCGGSFPSSVGDGQTCYVTPGSPAVNGSAPVLLATFKALADTGSASIGIASGSIIGSNGANIWNGSSSAKSVTLTAPATTTPPPTTGGGSTTPTNGSSAPSTGSTSGSASTTGTPSTGASTSTTSGSTDAATDTTTPEGTAEVKSATDTKKVAAAAVTAQSNDVSKKAVWTIILPFLIALIIFIALTYPVILSNLKKAKITHFVRQKFAKIASK